MWKSAGTSKTPGSAPPDVAMNGVHATALLHSACFLAPGCGVVAASVANTNIGTWVLTTTAIAVVAYCMCVVPSAQFTSAFRRRAAVGYVAGVIATVVYTAFRLPAVLLGIIPDVPAVLGDSMMDVRNVYWERSSASVVLGYVFHLFLTGAAWGSAYAAIARPSPSTGLAWASVIAAVFIVSPLFTTSLTYLDSTLPIWVVALIVWLSHLPYGWTLGFVMTRSLSKSDSAVTSADSPRATLTKEPAGEPRAVVEIGS